MLPISDRFSMANGSLVVRGLKVWIGSKANALGTCDVRQKKNNFN